VPAGPFRSELVLEKEEQFEIVEAVSRVRIQGVRHEPVSAGQGHARYPGSLVRARARADRLLVGVEAADRRRALDAFNPSSATSASAPASAGGERVDRDRRRSGDAYLVGLGISSCRRQRIRRFEDRAAAPTMIYAAWFDLHNDDIIVAHPTAMRVYAVLLRNPLIFMQPQDVKAWLTGGKHIPIGSSRRIRTVIPGARLTHRVATSITAVLRRTRPEPPSRVQREDHRRTHGRGPEMSPQSTRRARDDLQSPSGKCARMRSSRSIDARTSEQSLLRPRRAISARTP
jgi:hypothetical protein